MILVTIKWLFSVHSYFKKFCSCMQKTQYQSTSELKFPGEHAPGPLLVWRVPLALAHISLQIEPPPSSRSCMNPRLKMAVRVEGRGGGSS